MLTYERHLLKARVGTIIGVLFIASWTWGACLIIWNASFGVNPLEETFAATIYREGVEF